MPVGRSGFWGSVFRSAINAPGTEVRSCLLVLDALQKLRPKAGANPAHLIGPEMRVMSAGTRQKTRRAAEAPDRLPTSTSSARPRADKSDCSSSRYAT
jgi:hypothetical protein